MAVTFRDVTSPPPRSGAVTVADIVAMKRRAEARIAPSPGFPAMAGGHYLDELAARHRSAAPGLYLEIGSENGASLALARGRAIAVDPDMRLAPGATDGLGEAHLFRMTSDDFFAGGFLDTARMKVDLAFLDGMHLFEFLLRDVMNVERRMAPGGAILLHDCAPMSPAAARRDWNRAETPFWCGDVWKLLPILQEHRPDIGIRFSPARPSGLVELTGLNPRSTLLRRRYDRIVAEWRDVSIEDFGLDRFGALIAGLSHTGSQEQAPEPAPEPALEP